MTQTRMALIAGNWKMNYGPRQASSFALELLRSIEPIIQANPTIQTILCPPSISLAAVREVMDAMPNERIDLGAQNMWYEEKGAFTGEIAPEMVKELCSAVILGHSERRTYFGESDEIVNKKTLAALKHNLLPIVCIGENLEQYEQGRTHEVIQGQIKGSLVNLTPEQAARIVIAYEPIWAIGTGRAATDEGAEKAIHAIRGLYSEIYGERVAQTIRILYGGSVTGENISDFMRQPNIDGALVGGASLKPDFAEIVRQAARVGGK